MDNVKFYVTKFLNAVADGADWLADKVEQLGRDPEPRVGQLPQWVAQQQELQARNYRG